MISYLRNGFKFIFLLGMFFSLQGWAIPHSNGSTERIHEEPLPLRYRVKKAFELSGSETPRVRFEVGARVELTGIEGEEFYQVRFVQPERSERVWASGRELFASDQLEPEELQLAMIPSSLGTKFDESKQHAIRLGLRQAAARTLATYFQSCHAVDRVLRKAPDEVVDRSCVLRDGKGNCQQWMRSLAESKRDRYLELHPYLFDLKIQPPAPGCDRALVFNVPPLYGYGARPELRAGSFDLLIDQTRSPRCQTVKKCSGASGFCPGNGVSCQSSSVSAVDCSGLIAILYAGAGLKQFQGQTHPELMTTSTRSLHALIQNPNGCLAPIPLSEDFLQPGDILNQAGNHVVMVDQVGKDPLGLKAALKKLEEAKESGGQVLCDEWLNVEQLDFTYIHSGAIASLGLSRVHSSLHRSHGSALMTHLVSLARAYCKQVANEIPSQQIPISVLGTFSVLRHSGKSSCRFPKAFPLQGEECARQCDTLPSLRGVNKS